MVAEGSAVTGRLLTFLVGRARFAVLLEDVLGVQERIESATGVGVMFQGRPVVTVDARALGWGGFEQRLPVPHGMVIVVGCCEGSATALIVDRVEEIVEGVEMRPLPALVAPFVRGVFRGVALHAEGGRLVVDPAALPGAAGKMAADGGRGRPGEA